MAFKWLLRAFRALSKAFGRQAWLDYVTLGAFESELQQEGISVSFPTAPLVPYSRLAMVVGRSLTPVRLEWR